jgi:hypothetical protein
MLFRSFALGGALMLVLIGAQATSCSTGFEDCVCTEEFRVYGLTVVDDDGAPVNDASLEVVNLRTDRQLVSTFLGLPTSGTYWIVDDSMLDEFTVDGDSVEVTGTNDGLSFRTGFRFAVDECGCHVQKLAGPDTVTIR